MERRRSRFIKPPPTYDPLDWALIGKLVVLSTVVLAVIALCL